MTIEEMHLEDWALPPEQIALNNLLLDAALNLESLEFKRLIKVEKADIWYQDPTTGKGPLHLAVEGSSTGENGVEKGKQLAEWILMNGGIWNALDRNSETPACLARRLGCMEIYEVMISAGVRTEMLLNLLGRKETEDKDAKNNSKYLSSELKFTKSVNGSETLLDSENSEVMMSWETEIMRQTAEVLLPRKGLSVLNIGFGLGIVDGFFQEKKPRKHVIVEAHPDVLHEMRSRGWYEKEGVQIIEGRWQDFCEDLPVEAFDAVYYDCFAESYADLRLFFDSAVGLLDQNGIFSFFHGLGADFQTFYDVYTRLAELDLSCEFGFEVEYKDIPVDFSEEERKGVQRKYFKVDVYKLPICKLKQ
ncbi:Protein arginine N-methyltransferase 2 [Neolecta irregularis DAH-3]|uniref:Arginine N-methyltransferase 2 n=1 Tax=Neolecta irregularis (strain DAH-3) TaxID=1198029 RepID=A0A1U7LQK4_NEOID|nr:Protein arginine N-methyltransferase 2 [Neolecta irregularis DAH-3]|eukprot:OLL24863.1 Protein arginine N-methyltransferase 2 [Neolecta irregularis DAH-3]